MKDRTLPVNPQGQPVDANCQDEVANAKTSFHEHANPKRARAQLRAAVAVWLQVNEEGKR